LRALCKSSFTFFYLVGRQIAGAIAHWASENKRQENLLVLNDWAALYLSPEINY